MPKLSKKEQARRRNCGHLDTIDTWVTFKDGTEHVARTCENCGKMIKYVAHNQVPDRETGRILGLTYDDHENLPED